MRPILYIQGFSRDISRFRRKLKTYEIKIENWDTKCEMTFEAPYIYVCIRQFVEYLETY